MRYNVGHTVVYSHKVADLAKMKPRNDLCTSTFCLADPGKEYIIFQPDDARFTVYELQAGKKYEYEWFNTSTYEITDGGEVMPGSTLEDFAPPYTDAVFYLKLNDRDTLR